MAIKFTNFAYSTLAVGIGSGDTTIAVAGGHGARFPTLGVGDYFYATLENSGGTREIIKVTARAVDSLTAVRAQDNTTAVAWLAGDSIALRLNAKAIEEAVVGTLLAANNLADVSSASAARASLSVAPRATRIDVASVAGTVNLTTSAPDTDDIRITGALAITAFTVAIGRVIRVTASAAHTLTNNANIVTNTGANIVCAAGDTYVLRATAANTVEMLQFTRAGANNLNFSGSDVTVPGVLTVTGKPVFSAGFGAGNTNQSCVRVYTANGFGSTNTKIRRFTTTALNQGTDITYADSATLGALFTINVAGMYAISYSDSGTAATQIGLSLNTSTPTTAVGAIAAAERLTGGTTTAANGYFGSAVWTGYLASGALIRPHSDGIAVGATDNTQFTITRVS